MHPARGSRSERSPAGLEEPADRALPTDRQIKHRSPRVAIEYARVDVTAAGDRRGVPERGGRGIHRQPLGARALYIFRDGKDTMYRLHGTPEWNSIGKNASSGCVRLLNQDVMDLYDRVTGKFPIIVRASAGRRDQAVSLASAAATTQPIDAGVPRDAERLN